jgi:tetrahydromethanopterin S-methyltransferase subunit F
MKIKLKEGLTNPYEKNSKGLADKVLGWYDFDTTYIDDGGQRRSAERRNDSVAEWFGEHPIEIRKDAFKLIKSKVSTWGANYVSRFERTFDKHMKENIKEAKSLDDMMKDANRIKKELADAQKEYNKSKTETNKAKVEAKKGQLERVANTIRNARANQTENSIKENASVEAISIAQYTGTRKDAVQSFIDTHKLNAKKLLSYVAKGKMKDRMDFVSAIAGKDENPIQKKIIKMFEVANTKSTSLNEVTVTRIPNFNLESDAYIVMLYLLKNNSGFKKAATDAGIDLFSGANVKSVFAGLHNNLKKVITPQIIKAVVETINQDRKKIFIDNADIQKGVHTARFAGLLALGVVDSFINDPIDYKLINDLGNAKLKGLADEFSIGRGKIKLGVMMGNKGF